MIFTCQYTKCATVFTSDDSRRKYCSRSCAAIVNNSHYPKRQKTQREINCVTCDKLFYTYRKDAKYCSKICSDKRPRSTKFPKIKYCVTCDKPFHQESRVKNCSRECGEKYKTNKWIKRWLNDEVDGGTGKDGGARKKVKKYILKKYNYTCVLCDQGNIWNGTPLSLHVDHINGDNTNNRAENLRVLCPNCHTQTPTYCNKIRNNREETPIHPTIAKWQESMKKKPEIDKKYEVSLAEEGKEIDSILA